MVGSHSHFIQHLDFLSIRWLRKHLQLLGFHQRNIQYIHNSHICVSSILRMVSYPYYRCNSLFVPFKKIWKDENTLKKILFVLGPTFLHLFVKGGFYFIYVVPFYYWLFLLLIQTFDKSKSKYFITLILSINVGLTAVKGNNLMLQDNNAHKNLVAFIGESIPSESKVIPI